MKYLLNIKRFYCGGKNKEEGKQMPVNLWKIVLYIVVILLGSIDTVFADFANAITGDEENTPKTYLVFSTATILLPIIWVGIIAPYLQ